MPFNVEQRVLHVDGGRVTTGPGRGDELLALLAVALHHRFAEPQRPIRSRARSGRRQLVDAPLLVAGVDVQHHASGGLALSGSVREPASL